MVTQMRAYGAMVLTVEHKENVLGTIGEGVDFVSHVNPDDPLNSLWEKRESLADVDVEAFEKFLHRSFPGKTRFSIEGLDMLVPVLDEVIAEAALIDCR